ncbi:DinB family protein [Larkinella terrae]|uniref:DinB family protein n=1 Tax=Larkinella terrae TaxID=2025311 RepID=A0A7K0EM48_9BACT|nr:DinB family protein [Larkinella terrae]MRS62933.1 DinB family protein [Larkinella terrae]
MRTFQTDELLEQLTKDTQTLIQTVTDAFRPMTDADLNRQPAPDRWSIAQCLEHLNSYGHYYIPMLEAAIAKGEENRLPPAPTFQSGWLGNYFANSMQPQANGSIALKMKAVKAHTPGPKQDASAVLNLFLEQQEAILELLDRASRVNIQKLRVPISIARFIRLSTGDTFRFLIAHEQRHVLQALRVATELNLHPKISVES